MLVRSLAVVWSVTMLVGCVDGVDDLPPEEPKPEVTVEIVDGSKADDGVDICALAAQLPDDDICSLICDYDAFAERAVENGMEPGACYTFRCTLPGDVGVNVGVCSPE